MSQYVVKKGLSKYMYGIIFETWLLGTWIDRCESPYIVQADSGLCPVVKVVDHAGIGVNDFGDEASVPHAVGVTASAIWWHQHRRLRHPKFFAEIFVAIQVSIKFI